MNEIECENLVRKIKQTSLAGSTIVCVASSCMWEALLNPAALPAYNIEKLCDDSSFIIQCYPNMSITSTHTIRLYCKGYPSFLRELPQNGDISQLTSNLQLLMEACSPLFAPSYVDVAFGSKEQVHTSYENSKYLLKAWLKYHLQTNSII